MGLREQCMVKTLANRRFRDSTSPFVKGLIIGLESGSSVPVENRDQNLVERFLFHSQAAPEWSLAIDRQACARSVAGLGPGQAPSESGG